MKTILIVHQNIKIVIYIEYYLTILSKKGITLDF